MKTGEHTNDYGVRVTEHKCDTCGSPYEVCPGVDSGYMASHCMSDDCESYMPEHDLDVLFASDADLRGKPILSMDMLRKRKEGVKLEDGTYAARLLPNQADT